MPQRNPLAQALHPHPYGTLGYAVDKLLRGYQEMAHWFDDQETASFIMDGLCWLEDEYLGVSVTAE